MNKFTQSGFTLLELMLTIAMLGIITAIGIPSYRSMMVTNELVATGNAMRMSMKLARSEAITRGKDVIMCSSTDGATCSLADGNWVQGWIIGVELVIDGTINETDGELVSVHEMDNATQLTIVPSNPAFNQRVVYGYDGWLDAGVEAGFDICSGYGAANGYPRREIRASVVGEPQLTKNLVTRC